MADHLPIRVSALRGDQPTTFNLYVFINSKFILLIRKGDNFEGVRLERIRERKLEMMYVVAQEEPLFHEYVQKNLERAYAENSGATLQTRAEIAQGHQQLAAETLMENLSDEHSYKQARFGSEQYVKFLSSDQRVVKEVLSIKNKDQSLSAHGVTVATLAVQMAKLLSVTDPRVLQMIMLGGLLHDVAHYKSSVPFHMALNAMPPDVRSKYKRHPAEAAERLKTYKHFEPVVIRIIEEHEELADGTGFPKKLRAKEIHPMSGIVATANAYDRLVTFEKKKSADAVMSLIIGKNGKYLPEHINALKVVLSQNGLL